MKRLISFSIFFTLVLIVLLVKTSQAQNSVKVRTAVIAPSRIWVSGFWKWNPRHQRYVWIDGHWAHRSYARRPVRVRAVW